MSDTSATSGPAPYWNSYLAGIVLGLLLFTSFYMTGSGLGASGGMHRILTFFQDLVVPQHVDTTPYLAAMAGGDRPALSHWLVYEVLGALAGGFASGWLHGRLGFETFKGPQISTRTRWVLAFAGGGVMGFGARLARGCTSGQALSGGAVLSVGSWAFMFSIFGGGYAAAYFVRKLWT